MRGQYTHGAIDGKPVKGYLEDLGEESSRTETFVALKCEVHTLRWANVPFYLRTGKRLPSKFSGIVIQFRSPPFSIFPVEKSEMQPNKLIIRLQPEEGMRLEMMTKEPGPGGLRLRPTGLDISFEKTFAVRYPDAYERLLMDTVRGNATLFMRRDEVEAAWSLGGADHRGMVKPPRGSEALPGRKLGSDRLDRLDRAGRPHMARGNRLTHRSGTAGADHRAEDLPGAAGPAGELHLADGVEIGRARLHLDARQQDRDIEGVQIGGLPHDVPAREIPAALLQHLNQRHARAVAEFVAVIRDSAPAAGTASGTPYRRSCPGRGSRPDRSDLS